MSPEALWVERNGLSVDPAIAAFIETELLPEIAREPGPFWAGFAALIADLTPTNRALLAQRDALQAAIDAWHRAHPAPWEHEHYVTFLRSIGYLGQPVAPFVIETANVDPEIAAIPGPQLVVPVDNARFAINACNARWGSLYDAPSTSSCRGGGARSERTGENQIATNAAGPPRAETIITSRSPMRSARRPPRSAPIGTRPRIRVRMVALTRP